MSAGKKKRTRRIVLACLITAALAAAVGLSLSAIYDSERDVDARIARHPVAAGSEQTDTVGASVLKVMTLNLAHGRKSGAVQSFTRTETVKRNLDDIAEVLSREAPGLVALQEADAPSIWSGSFDHVAYLAESAGFSFSFHGEHVNGPGLHYGTALLSRLPIENALSHPFRQSWPTFTKGMVKGTVRLAGPAAHSVDVVSVHLDFSRESTRRDQLDEMAEKLRSCGPMLIVMGDFNCDWDDGDAMLAAFARRLGLKAYRPLATGLETHSLLARRIDWVLVSEALEFVSHRILPDRLSDHRAVVAEIRLPAERE